MEQSVQEEAGSCVTENAFFCDEHLCNVVVFKSPSCYLAPVCVCLVELCGCQCNFYDVHADAIASDALTAARWVIMQLNFNYFQL